MPELSHLTAMQVSDFWNLIEAVRQPTGPANGRLARSSDLINCRYNQRNCLVSVQKRVSLFMHWGKADYNSLTSYAAIAMLTYQCPIAS